MNCIFKRDGEYLKCECCGSSIKTLSDKVKMNCKGGEGCVKPEYPSIFEMAKNATVAAVEYVQSGFKTSDDGEVQRRMSICKECPFYDAVQNRCTKCGCFLSWKTSIESGKCPEDKW